MIDAPRLIASDTLHKLERLQLLSRARLGAQSRGERRSKRRGSSAQFADYRAYSHGDDPRRVDWNVYGRSGELFVKLFEDEELLTVHLCVDVSRSMDFGQPNKLDVGKRIAAALGYVALCRFDRVYAAALDDAVAGMAGPLWGRDQAATLFGAIGGWRARGETNLEAALRAYAARAGRAPGLAIVISDLLSPTWEEGLRALLRARHEVALVHLLAPEEVQPPLGEEMRLVDRENGRTLQIHMDQHALDGYARRFAEWTGAIERFCADHGVAYARLDSDVGLESALFDTLRRRRIVS